MANDAADFYVRLHDELTGPARAMRTELKGLKDDLKKFNTGSRGTGLGGGGARREKRSTDGIREPKMLTARDRSGIREPKMVTANDRIRMQEREEKLALRARDKSEREQVRVQKASERAAAQGRREQQRNVKGQERDAARLRGAMQRDERAKLASVARQDKAIMKNARDQERAQQTKWRNDLRQQRSKEKAFVQGQKAMKSAESRRLADAAHKKVLEGKVGAEVKDLLTGKGGIGGIGSLVSSMSGLSSGGLLVAGGLGAAAASILAISAAAAAAAVGIGILAAKFTSASIEAMRFAQTSEVALGNLLHGGANARKEFDSIVAMSADLGLNVEDSVGSFKKLLAAQFEVGRAKELIAMSADLQGIGANAEEVKRALLAITQIKSKGRLMAEEMLQLQEAGISAELVYEDLGKRLGKTTAELRKMQQAGEIDSALGIESILAAVRKKTGTKEAGELGRKVARETLDGMLRSLTAGVTKLFIDVGRKLEPIVMPIAQKVIGVFDTIRNHDGLRSLGDLIVRRLARVRDWVVESWPQIQDTLVTGLNAAAAAGTSLIAVGDYIVDHWGEIEPILTVVGITAGLVAVNMVAMGAAVTVAMAPMIVMALAVGKLVAGLERLKELAKEIGPRHLAARLGIDLGPGKNIDLNKREKTPELIAEEKLRERSGLGNLRVAGAANDNADSWWAKGETGSHDFAAGAARSPTGALLASRGEQAGIAPVRSSAAKGPANLAPVTNAGNALGGAADATTASAGRTTLAAERLIVAAESLTSAAGKIGAGGSGGGESSLIGMLEAI